MKILLHSCCAPCSAPILEWLINNNIKPSVYYYNPNIFPFEEYEIRRNEIKNYCKTLNINFFEGDYNHDLWLEKIKGLENQPERGNRCLECFKMRLLQTAKFAEKEGFDTIASTLSSSRWKSLDQIDLAGNLAVSQVSGVEYLARNWRKGGLQDRRNQLLKLNNFYNQLYCGCEFSKQNN
ncbi:MAG: epoxyqueuosine reductase QueH [Bacteroidales bacterium]|nr:epoxyqueuosine reductase QueH [Bacteroidales bacterium]